MTSPRYPIHLASSHFYPRTWEPYLIPMGVDHTLRLQTESDHICKGIFLRGQLTRPRPSGIRELSHTT